VPHVWQLKNFERIVIKAIPTLFFTFVIPSNLKICLEVPKASGKLEKNFESRGVGDQPHRNGRKKIKD